MSIPVPAAFLAQPRTAHRPVWTVTARNASGASAVLPIADDGTSSITKDAGQYPRTSCSLVVPERWLNPHTVADLLMPYTTTVTITYGFEVDDVVASVVVATLRLVSTTADRPGGILDLEAVDTSSLIDGEQLAGARTYAGGTSCADAIRAIVATDYHPLGGPVVVVDQLSTYQRSVAVPTGYSWTGSPWSAVEELSDLMGSEAYFDATGRLILRPVPVPALPAVFTLDTGAGGVLTGMRSAVERAPNAVSLVYARSSGSPVVGVWVDNRVGSPSNVAGGYGIRRLVVDRNGSPTLAQANEAAKRYAQRVVGRGRSVDYRAVPVPWLEPGDTVAIEPVDGGPLELHAVQSGELPLGGDPMTVSTRDALYGGPI